MLARAPPGRRGAPPCPKRGQRVLAGGSTVQVGVVEDMELARHRPARQVAPSRPRGGEPRGRQERVGGRKPPGVGWTITVIPPGTSSKRSSRRSRRSSRASSVRWAESVSSPSWRARKLSDSVSIQATPARVDHSRGGPSRKPGNCGLLTQPRSAAALLDLDGLLEGRAVDPGDPRLGDRADRAEADLSWARLALVHRSCRPSG